MSTVSSSFLMRNGTKQDSILSPYLFSVYMCDISLALNQSGIGCHVGGTSCNIIFYADDMVIPASSTHGASIAFEGMSTHVGSCLRH